MTESNNNALKAYCVKCRTKRDMRLVEPVFTKTGTPGTRGQCGECGTKLFRMGATAAHDGMPKPEKIERPKRKKTKAKPRKKTRSRAKGKTAANPNGKRQNVGKLVIVESPAKARSIGGYLGAGYTVMSSLGHVRDLLRSRLSVDVEADFEPEYRVPNDKRAIVKELKAAAEGADEIYLATDPDREGEAIAWHLVAAAEMPQPNIKRVVFHEITDGAVADAFSHPRQINMDLVNAQQARRILDRLVGYQVSQLLWSKVRGGLSAGRVQSIALRLVVEREKEIEAHVAVEYWTVDAELAKQGAADASGRFTASLVKIADANVTYNSKGDKAPVLDSEATVRPHVNALQQSQFVVDAVKRGTRRSRPAPPFTTSTLQQAASNRRRLSARRTMQLAQQLYEGINIGGGNPVGLITYMRTDSVQVSKQAVADARAYIGKITAKTTCPRSRQPTKPEHAGPRKRTKPSAPPACSVRPRRCSPFWIGRSCSFIR